ncbi:hypothetical protein SAMN04488556_3680 [Halostagnicola kamekurae]|uniref:Uncharacterized protein n=1 Tax=Halostagnicola kamekurae TaxID=619731 RepID=A0A1I6UAI5_9EURY|nr:hypothetical protein SAMN04488556_3680 [Halostagnicola kamekurae]
MIDIDHANPLSAGTLAVYGAENTVSDSSCCICNQISI